MFRQERHDTSTLHQILTFLCVTPMQERAQNIEAQLSETTKQLHDLRVRQKQLEARNLLLEKVAKLNQQPSQEASEPAQPAGRSGELWDSIQV